MTENDRKCVNERLYSFISLMTFNFPHLVPHILVTVVVVVDVVAVDVADRS